MGLKPKCANYELVSPDGGWGYMIGVAVIINLVTISAFMPCFGMIFKEVFIELNMNSTSITILNGVGAFCIALSGFVAGPILKVMSIRQLGIAAALLYNLGALGTVFIRTKLSFIICYGILQSIGNGMIFNLSCTMLNNYFVKRRMLAVSFTQTIISISGLVAPPLLKWSIDAYGTRGTLLLISAVSLHSIVGMALMQPVAWHMKKVELPENKENEMKSLLPSDKVVGKELSETKDMATNEKMGIENQELKKKNSRFRNIISEIIDVPVYKSFFFSNASVGVALCVFSELTFTIMLPQALYSMGWSEGDVALGLSLTGLGDLVARMLFIVTSSVLARIGSHEVYVAGLVIAFVTRLGMLWSDNRKVMLFFITTMGISRCTIMVLFPVVVADAVGQDKFTSAMGLVMLIFGFFNIAVGPVIGAVRDLTDSYATAFYILTSCFGIVIMFWSIELIYKKNKHKRHPKADISDKP